MDGSGDRDAREFAGDGVVRREKEESLFKAMRLRSARLLTRCKATRFSFGLFIA